MDTREGSIISRSTSLLFKPIGKGSGKSAKLGTISCISLIVNKMIGTGIFLTPSIIYQYCQGNVAVFLLLWIIGGLVVLCGLAVFLEFALNLPFENGGEKNYLLKVFKKPKGLIGCIYTFQMVFLGFSSGNAFAFGKYALYAIKGLNSDINDTVVTLTGVLCITFCISLNVWYPHHGTSLYNFLGVLKIVILIAIIFIGALVSINVIHVPTTPRNAGVIMETSAQEQHSLYSVSVALLEIIYSFKGWENANYVLLEVSDPYHVLTIAAPGAVLMTTVLYILVIVSYLVVIPKQEFLDSGVLVAGVFFTKIFGESLTSRVLPVLICLSNLGNVMVVSFAHSYVNQELARNNYLPFSNLFQDIRYSLFLHWAITVIVMVGPPSSEIYEFVVNLSIYPATWVCLLITSGLIYIRWIKAERWGKRPSIPSSYTQETADGLDEENNLMNDETYTEFDSLLSLDNTLGSTFSAPILAILVFWLANVFLALFPFVPPPRNSHFDNAKIPFWCFPVVGSLVLLLGGVWFYLRKWFYQWKFNKFGVGLPQVKYEEDYYETTEQ